MNRAEVVELTRWLDRLGIEYVVVGGSAIEFRHSVGTKDVGPLIAVGDWAPLDQAIQGRPDASPLEPFTGTIRGSRVQLGTQLVDVEFISGKPFCGGRRPDDFVRFVRSRRSTLYRGVHFANPSVVWYMRLSTRDWETYILKIEQDLRAGVPRGTMDDVLEIAGHFGVRPLLVDRVDFVRQTLQLFEPAGRDEPVRSKSTSRVEASELRSIPGSNQRRRARGHFSPLPSSQAKQSKPPPRE
jgi:hypothetical protein